MRGPIDVAEARDVLLRALAVEDRHPVTPHPYWERRRMELRRHMLNEDFSGFLAHPVVMDAFFRYGWGPAQDLELGCLRDSPLGRRVLDGLADPPVGRPWFDERLPEVSANMLGQAYYMLYLERLLWGLGWPERVVEVGGGYGAFSWLYCQQSRSAAYALVDLPEMLALQHYFLSSALPGREIRLASSADDSPGAGETLLVPTGLALSCPLRADLFFSTFAFAEMSRREQEAVEELGFWGAGSLLLAGGESGPEGFVTRTEATAAAGRQFDDVVVEPFYTEGCYVLTAKSRIGAPREVAVVLKGGMGNQLFQYAFGRSLESRGYEVSFDRGRLVDDVSNVPAELRRQTAPYGEAAPGYHDRDRSEYSLDGFRTRTARLGGGAKEWTTVTEPSHAFHPELLDPEAPSVLDGYWQTEKYFLGIAGEIRDELGLANEPSAEIMALAERLSGTNSVALHVRRGERILVEANIPVHGIIQPSFYERGLRLIESLHPGPEVYVFSDDPEWCSQNVPFGTNVNTTTRFCDMWLMSRCRHIVMPNSSFSWWAAWLGDGRPDRVVVVPDPWFLTDADTRDLVPDRWTKMPREA